MNKRNSILLALAVIGLLFAGFIFLQGDPHSSRTQVVLSDVQNPAPYISPTNPVVYTDDFDGANDTTALKTRGYKVWYRGSGPQGAAATWFQGNDAVFPSYNGPTTGYVAANYQVVTGANNIDSWLVLPYMAGGLSVGDSLYFYSRSPTGDTFPDSIRVMVSAGDSVPEGTWTELGRFKVNVSGSYELKGFRSTLSGPNARFAIRYTVADGGPSGTNSDFIGVDALTIVRSAAPPTSCNLYSTAWCPAATFANLPAGTFYEAAAWLGDTLYCQTPDASGVATTTIIRYTWRGTWSTGVPLPVVKEGGTLTACGNKLYYIGGSSSVATGSTDTYEYNPATGTWTLKAPMPAALSGHGTVNWGDSVLFVVSGNWAAPSTGVYAYRPASNTWITTSPCPFGRRSHATGISGNKIFMAAGYNAGYKKELAIGTIGSNASTISWVTGPSIPVSYNGISRTGGTAYGDKFYVVAGEREVGLQSDETWVWNIAGGTWTMISGKPVAVSNNFAGVTSKCINDTLRVFCVGGMNASSVGVNNLDVISCGPAVVGIGTINSGMPLTYNLSQNYPNPFNPVTRIAYTMPKSGNVKLIVYDILGKEVATLVNEFKATGTYSVDFDGSNLASGVYLYRIESGDFTAVKKMLLIK